MQSAEVGKWAEEIRQNLLTPESLKSQAPKNKSQTNTNNRKSKFKTVRMIARHQISDQSILVIGIWNFGFVWSLRIIIRDFRSYQKYQIFSIYKL